MDKCREAFEQLPEIKNSLGENIVFVGNKYTTANEGFYDLVNWLNGGWYTWQSRQAEVDQQKLLTIDSELHLDAAKEEIERLKGVVDKALNLINNWWHPNVDQKLFVEALGRALRGEHE